MAVDKKKNNPHGVNQYTPPDPRQSFELQKINSVSKVKFNIKTHNYIYDKPGYVYAIKIGDYLKIGKTFNIQKRLEHYGSFPPFEYEILMVDYVCDNSFYERHFQSIFKEFQVKGEWFYIGDVTRYHEYVVDNYKYLLEQINDIM